MMMSSASNSSASCITVWPVTEAGTMIHAARGLVSFDAKSASDDEPIAPRSASSFTFGSLWSYTTHSWPSFMRRRTSPLPMRPSPIIPSCMCFSSRCVFAPSICWCRYAPRSLGPAHLLGLRVNAGEEVVPRPHEGVGDRRPQRQPGVIGGDRDLHHPQLTNCAEKLSRPLAPTRRDNRRRHLPHA